MLWAKEQQWIHQHGSWQNLWNSAMLPPLCLLAALPEKYKNLSKSRFDKLLVQVIICISRVFTSMFCPQPSQTELKFDQDSKACWSVCSCCLTKMNLHFLNLGLNPGIFRSVFSLIFWILSFIRLYTTCRKIQNIEIPWLNILMEKHLCDAFRRVLLRQTEQICEDHPLSRLTTQSWKWQCASLPWCWKMMLGGHWHW